MGNSSPDKDYYKLVKALHFTFKYFFIICIAIMIIMGITASIFYFSPNENIQHLLDHKNLNFSLSLQGVKIQFSPSIIDPNQAKIFDRITIAFRNYISDCFICDLSIKEVNVYHFK